MATDQLVIEQIAYRVTWLIRHEVMWPDKPLEFVQLEDDPEGYHFGLYKNHVLVGVISLFLRAKEAQFRKLAVLESQQRRGYGNMLLHHVFQFCQREGINRIYCNARIEKTGLYEKLGMVKTDSKFEKGGRDFVVMEKYLG